MAKNLTKEKRIALKIAPLGPWGYVRIAIILFAIAVVAAHLYYAIFTRVEADAVGNALGSMSVAGSIITGLCITGVSAMDGGLLKRLTRTYGEHLRSVFFAWFTSVSAIIIASGVLHAIPDTRIARIVASLMPPLLFVAVTGLAYSVFKLYRIEDEVIRGEEESAAASDASPPGFDSQNREAPDADDGADSDNWE